MWCLKWTYDKFAKIWAYEIETSNIYILECNIIFLCVLCKTKKTERNSSEQDMQIGKRYVMLVWNHSVRDMSQCSTDWPNFIRKRSFLIIIKRKKCIYISNLEQFAITLPYYALPLIYHIYRSTFIGEKAHTHVYLEKIENSALLVERGLIRYYI